MNNQDNNFNIHWYPGHMAKTKRMIEDNLKLVDVIAEISDARIPEAGRNPVLNELVGNKPRLLLLNKKDCADAEITKKWVEYYKALNLTAVACDCRSGAGLNNIVTLLIECAKTAEHSKFHKYSGAVRVMVMGIPNAGKSSFINRMAGNKKTSVGNRPGVTRGKQWVVISKQGKTAEFLDLPGILPPKLDVRETALKLAYTGAVKDEVMDVYSLASSLAEYLAVNHKEKLSERYKLANLNDLAQNPPLNSGVEVLELIAKARGMMISGGEPDVRRAATALLDDFRNSKIGRITLEQPS